VVFFSFPRSRTQPNHLPSSSHNKKVKKQRLTMAGQAPTPRTTRNSRGLRSSTDSCLGDSARVSRRRRSSGTPTRANLYVPIFLC
jgi:hypothetical protein